MKPFRYSLIQILLVIVCLLLAAPLALVGLVGSLATDKMSQNISQRNLSLATSLAGEVEEVLARAGDLLQETGSNISQGLVAPSMINDYLAARIKYHPNFFNMILLLDPTGLVKYVAPYRRHYVGIDWSRHVALKGAAAGGKVHWSGTFRSPRTGHPTITLSVPYKNGTVVGYLDLSRLGRIVGRVDLGEKGYAAIVDQKGTAIAHREASYVDQQYNLKGVPVVRQGLEGQRGVLQFSHQGQKKLGSVVIVKQTGWPVVVVQSAREAFAPVRWMVFLVWVGALVIGVIAALAAFWLVKTVQRPIAMMTSNAERVAGGEYVFEPPKVGFSELAVLASAFKAMIGSIEAREQDIKASEERLRALVESSSDSIVTLDTQRRITSCNSAFLEQFGYSRPEVLNRSVEIIHTDKTKFEEFGEKVYPRLSEQGSWRGDWVYRHKNGKLFPMESSLSPLRDPQGRVVGYVSIIRDITERKQAEEALLQSEQKYRNILESIQEGYYEVDLAGSFTFSNTAMRNILGCDKEEMQRLNNRDYMDDETAKRVYRDFNKVFRTGEPAQLLDWRLIRKGGSTGMIQASVSLMRGAGGEAIGFRGMCRDVTEQKRAEQELIQSRELFKSVFQSHPYPLLLCRRDDGEVQAVNSAFARVWGYHPEDLLGQSARRLHDSPQSRDELLARLAEDSRLLDFITTGVKKDGTLAPCSLSVEPVEIGGEPHIVVTAVDITDKRRLENQLRQSQKMEAMGTLAGGIAHDFNNILAAIMGYSELGLDAAHGGKATPNEHEQVLRSAGRAKELVQQILTFSRKAEFELKPLDLNKEIDNIKLLLDRTIPKMISVKLRLDQDVGLVSGDANQIEQVILNLATNAADAMPDGGRLLIETGNVTLNEEHSRDHIEAPPGQYVLLRISDTGHGMDAETMKQIFDPFFTTKGVGKGTGLGMSTVFGIVKGHEGYLTCHSKQGQGTTFNIFFPVLDTDEEPSMSETTVIGETPGGNETVLVVDDEQALRELGCEMLMNLGYKTVAASSGEEALDIYQDKDINIDLVVLDLGMPGMGGHQALKEILSINPEAKVVIASGYSRTGQVKDALESGAVGYVAKPFRMADLLKTVREVLDE